MSRVPDPAELPVRPGEIVDDKFRIERVLGAGGMGVVVEATHLWLRQPVALKFIRRELARDQSNVARFLREARACVQLRNEHIARIMDVGALPDDTHYIVMEYLEGRTVDEVLRQDGPLPAATAVGYVLQACVGMAEAHALGIVHRDLKPHNLFITNTPAGRPLVKILDFGISKTALTGAEDHSLTDSHTILGSPAYMAPEQMESSRDVDVHADIWSLGAILFALVSGQPPFRGQTLLQLCARVESGQREPLDVEGLAVPAGVVEVIDACLRRAPAERPADLAEVAARLAPFTPGGAELAAEVAATLGASPRAPRPEPATEVPRRPGRVSRGALTATEPSQESIGSPTPLAPPTTPRRGARVAAAATTIAIIAGVTWYATRDRSGAASAARLPPDGATVTSGGNVPGDASGATAPPTEADATPMAVDAGAPDGAASVDDSGPRRDRPAPRRREPPVNPTPPTTPTPTPPLDAGVTEPARHPRDRRN